MGACSSACSSRRTSTPARRDTSDSYRASEKEEEEEDKLEFSSVHCELIDSLYPADSAHLITTSADKRIYVYNWIEHILKHVFEMPAKAATKVVYNSSSQWIHAGSRCGQICSWKWSCEAPPNTAVMILKRHTLGVTALACTDSQANLLVSGSRDNSVRVWDTAAEQCVRTCEISRNLVTGMKWIEGESTVAQSSEDKTLRVWDVRTCSVVQQTPTKRYIQLCCDVSQCGQYLLSGSNGTGGEGGELTLWDRRSISRRPYMEFVGHSGSVNGCMFLDNVKSTGNILASCSTDSTVRLWDQSTENCLSVKYVTGAGPVSDIISPSPGLLACSTFRNGVYVWLLQEKESGQLVLDLRAKY